ncbi:MAG: aldo/keto reductase [Bacteroidota bacterium]
MQMNQLGRTSLKVSALGLGLAAVGRPGYINLGHGQDLGRQYAPLQMEANAHALLGAAYKRGIRYFDAARSYGKAEYFLSTWLEKAQPQDATIGSKWGYTYTAGWEVDAAVHEEKDHSLAVLDRQWQETQSLLANSLNIYHIHSATLESGVLENAEVLAKLGKLKADGIQIGLSLSGPRQAHTLRMAQWLEVDGVPLFDVVQATWNLLEPSAGPALAEARESGMGVIIKEALANGRLTSRNTDIDFTPSLTLLEGEARRLLTTVDALSLAAVLNQSWADVVLIGAVRQDHLISNLKALEVNWDEEASEKLSILPEPPAQYWDTRKKLKWN